MALRETLGDLLVAIKALLEDGTIGLAQIESLVDDLETRCTEARLSELDAANLPADINTLLTRITAAVALASVCTEVRLAELNAVNIPADIDTLLTRVTAAVALASVCTEVRLAELAAVNLPADIDTLLTRITAAVALASVCTEVRLAELTAANIPADIDTLLTRITAAVALASVCTEARLAELAAANLPADIDGLKASRGRMLFSMDFWSLPQEEVALTVAAGDKALPSVTVADLPGTATIVRAIAMFKFRMVEAHTYVGENKLDGAQEIQVAGSVGAINFVNTQFTLAEDAREGGDVVIGIINIAATVNANGAYAFHWDSAKALQTGINFNDVQMGLRIWYSV